MATVIEVGTLDQFNAAIAYVDAQTSGEFAIQLKADINLGTSQLAQSGGNLVYGDYGNGATATSRVDGQDIDVPARNDLYALNLDKGVKVTIDGDGHVLDGRDGGAGPATYRGLFVYAGEIAITDLTIQHTLARGGNGDGGGAGLGGGLFVAGAGNPNGEGNIGGSGKALFGDVTLINVTFSGNEAVGGDGSSNGFYYGGTGGGLGGDGGGNGGNIDTGGGGVGGSGSANFGNGGDGIVLGAPSGGESHTDRDGGHFGGGGGQGGSGGGAGAGGVGGARAVSDRVATVKAWLR